jgi:hypothetical protein
MKEYYYRLERQRLMALREHAHSALSRSPYMLSGVGTSSVSRALYADVDYRSDRLKAFVNALYADTIPRDLCSSHFNRPRRVGEFSTSEKPMCITILRFSTGCESACSSKLSRGDTFLTRCLAPGQVGTGPPQTLYTKANRCRRLLGSHTLFRGLGAFCL